jgi:hypothetical protein
VKLKGFSTAQGEYHQVVSHKDLPEPPSEVDVTMDRFGHQMESRSWLRAPYLSELVANSWTTSASVFAVATPTLILGTDTRRNGLDWLSGEPEPRRSAPPLSGGHAAPTRGRHGSSAGSLL